MEDFDDGIGIFASEDTLLIDGDILVYRPCCIFEDDTARDQEMIMQNIDKKVGDLCTAADVEKYIVYLTTNKNFRDHIVDDYKANRVDKERPVNLAFSKKYMVKEHGAIAVPYLEADDLLAINQTDNTIIWSLDKDLMQVPGKHLDDTTGEVIVVDDLGAIWKDGKKWRFSGYKGLMLQALTGDGADWIVGCGTRSGKLSVKTGFKARQGIGPAAAAKLLNTCAQHKEAFEEVVAKQYMLKFGMNDWQVELENQVNLLFMVQKYKDGIIRRWTLDGRNEHMEIKTGYVIEDKVEYDNQKDLP